MLAKVDVQVQGQPLGKLTALLLEHMLLILAVAIAILVLMLMWAKYLRGLKLKKRRPGGQRVYREPQASEPEEEPAEATSEERRRYKYRWRRRKHRVRNPTLAETGGLPPQRSEEKTPSS